MDDLINARCKNVSGQKTEEIDDEGTLIEDQLSESLKCPSYERSTSYARNARRVLFSSFIKDSIAKKKCENCGVLSRAIRKDGYTKILQKPLSKTAAAKMNMMGNTQVKVRSG
jgi:hypothetical protein